MKQTCIICGAENEVRDSNYRGWTCDCGQRYEWDECHMIVLTTEQIDALRKLRPDFVAVKSGNFSDPGVWNGSYQVGGE